MQLLDYLTEGIAILLAFFYRLVPSYGVAIILLTLTVMIVLTPLTLKGTRSMMAMQRLQPELKKIQTQYKDDRERLNEELLGFYKENNINPLGGCLPLLLQLPVFLVLYQVLRGLTRREPDLGAVTGWVQGRIGLGETATDPPDFVLERTFDPAYLNPSSEMYQSLHGSFEMRFLGMDLSESASQVLGESFVSAIPYFILIALVALTGWYQQRQIQGRQTAATQSSQQQMIMKLMPIMLPVISFTLPGGLVVYFLASNTYRVGQQWWITRTMYGPEGPLPGKGGDKGKDKGGSKADVEDHEGNGDGRRGQSAGKGRPTPKRDGGRAAKSSGRGGGKSGGSGSDRDRPKRAKSTSKSRKKKTFTSDPARRKGRGDQPTVEPRGRKPRKKS